MWVPSKAGAVRAYKLLLVTLLVVLLFAVVVEGTLFEVLADLWAELQRSLPV